MPSIPSDSIPVSLERHWIENGEVRIHVQAAGPDDGPLVVLLHGFPEFWYGWRHQIPALVDAGYRVLVPDQRGYNQSSKPAAWTAYDVDRLVDDVCSLIVATGREGAAIVGHDWGAVVGWYFAYAHPARLRRLAVLNGPHPYVFRNSLRSSPAQLLRSMYALFFQLPTLPEWLLGFNQGQLLGTLLRWSGHPDTWSDTDRVFYRQAWGRPGALRGMLNWYRAAARRALRVEPPSAPIEEPTLILWGAQDVALSRRMAASSVSLCKNGRLKMIDTATHWVQHDAPAIVKRHLLDHLSKA